MKDSQRFILAACAIFVLVAGAAELLLPPDPYSTLPTNVAAILVCWPIAYWIVYRRRGNGVF